MIEKNCRFVQSQNTELIKFFKVAVSYLCECENVVGYAFTEDKTKIIEAGLVSIAACSITRSMLKCPRNIK